ncbi:hypothetical protein [Mesorhizobium humile]|uniref:Uncharacterized protein n=1 Tax=Mesorhizobium humile TaxID=3072313 RepID=A0ABU4YM38_9HYPH|nr:MULTISPECIES: hypothetical protein [unclassified Mesorhizobium]MDX8459288.1 hypothetical protein [Mesorhizobium sp. VK2D]MDX8488053.1 hypothetical protein [Mesorhizobium sp. VK2B]
MHDATSRHAGLARKISRSYTVHEFLKLNQQYLMNIGEYKSTFELTYLQCGVIKIRRCESQAFLHEIRAMPDPRKKGAVLETTLVGALALWKSSKHLRKTVMR